MYLHEKAMGEIQNMRTVSEVSKLTGVSVRTLHYYDEIDLLHPTEVTEAGYRLYDDTAMERLQQIMLFRELEFPLKEIREIINSSNFDRNRALEQQIQLLTLKKEHIENLITLARGIKFRGVKNMDFSAFDTTKLDEYARQAKENWGKTEAYKEFEQKTAGQTRQEQQQISEKMMEIFVEFGQMTDRDPGSEIAQKQVKKLQDYITENFYTCTTPILASFSRLYGGGGDFTEYIDKAGGVGTAGFAARAIEIYCEKNE